VLRDGMEWIMIKNVSIMDAECSSHKVRNCMIKMRIAEAIGESWYLETPHS
jgi:hypothetical protein